MIGRPAKAPGPARPEADRRSTRQQAHPSRSPSSMSASEHRCASTAASARSLVPPTLIPAQSILASARWRARQQSGDGSLRLTAYLVPSDWRRRRSTLARSRFSRSGLTPELRWACKALLAQIAAKFPPRSVRYWLLATHAGEQEAWSDRRTGLWRQDRSCPQFSAGTCVSLSRRRSPSASGVPPAVQAVTSAGA
jgi:hypothetical protein